MPSHGLGIAVESTVGKVPGVGGIEGGVGKMYGVGGNEGGVGKVYGVVACISASNLRRLTMGDANFVGSCKIGGARSLATPKISPVSWGLASSYSGPAGTCP